MRAHLALLRRLGALPLLLVPAPVHADEHARTSSLSWVRLNGAESCIATQALAQAAEERLKRKVFVSASDADVSVEGHVERKQPRGWHASLTIRDRDGALLGTRDVDSAETSCSALDESLALVISLMIDPNPASSAAEPPPQVPPPAPPPPPIILREKVLVPVPTPPPEPWRIDIDASSTLGVGVLPGAAVGLTLDAVLKPPRFFGVLLSGTYFMPASVGVERGASVDLALAEGTLAACPLDYLRSPYHVRACAGMTLGVLRSSGIGFDATAVDESIALDATVQGRFSVRIVGPLWGVLAVAIAVPVMRSELFYVTPDGVSHELFRASPIAALGDLGLGVHFP